MPILSFLFQAQCRGSVISLSVLQKDMGYTNLKTFCVKPCFSKLKRLYVLDIIHQFEHPHFVQFVHSTVCLTTGPWPLPKLVLHRVRSSASSFNFQYLLFSLRSFSSCLRLLPCLPVISLLLNFLQSRVSEGSFCM
jgi:hypothetical protein